ncbi:hypothetical protein ACJX0J_013457, partial [Zea mays]
FGLWHVKKDIHSCCLIAVGILIDLYCFHFKFIYLVQANPSAIVQATFIAHYLKNETIIHSLPFLYEVWDAVKENFLCI